MVKSYDKKPQQPPKPRPPTTQEMDAMMAVSLLRDMSAHAVPGTLLRVKVGAAEVEMVPRDGAFAEAATPAAAPPLALLPDAPTGSGKVEAVENSVRAATRSDDDELLGPVIS